MKIARTPAGEWRGTLDNPEEGVSGIAIGVALTGDTVKLDVSIGAYSATFEGKLSGDRIAGQWTHQAAVVPFTFTRRTANAPAQAVAPDLRRYQAQIANPRDWMDVDGTEVPIPPSEHPRLYLRARDLDDLRKRIEDPGSSRFGTTCSGARPPIRRSASKWTLCAIFLNRDPDLGQRTIAAALGILESATYDKTVQDISRAIGRMMVTGAIVYDWCYPLLTGEQKQRFLAQEVRLAKLMETGYPPYDGSYLTGHGSEWMIMRDMLSAGVALYDESPEMYGYAANRFFKGLLPARNFWYRGHAFHQGSAYAETRVSSELYPLWIFDRMGFGNVYNPSQQLFPTRGSTCAAPMASCCAPATARASNPSFVPC